MKWIHMMLQDGSYEDFKKKYIQCVLTNKKDFIWEGKIFRKHYAKSIVKYTDLHVKKLELKDKILK